MKPTTRSSLLFLIVSTIACVLGVLLAALPACAGRRTRERSRALEFLRLRSEPSTTRPEADLPPDRPSDPPRELKARPVGRPAPALTDVPPVPPGSTFSLALYVAGTSAVPDLVPLRPPVYPDRTYGPADIGECLGHVWPIPDPAFCENFKAWVLYVRWFLERGIPVPDPEAGS